MKIAFVANKLWEMYLFRGDVIKALVQDGHEVWVLTPSDTKNEETILKELGVKFANANVRLNRGGTNVTADLKLLFKLTKIYKQQKFDLIFHYTIKPNVYGTLAAFFTQTPSIAITTGLGYVFVHNNLMTKIARTLYKITSKLSQEVWFLNEDDYGVFREKIMIPDSKCFILPSEGVNLQKYEPQAKEGSNKHIIFLMVGRIVWFKGYKEYIEAAKIVKRQYPEVEFQLLGVMDGGHPDSVPQAVFDSDVSTGIINYLGITDNVCSKLKEADCIVLPSHSEGISRTLLEGASMAKPLIATNITGCKEVIDDEITGFLCEVKNSEDLASKMLDFIQLPTADKEKMGKLGRAKVEKEFNMDSVIKIYKEKIIAFRKKR